MTTSTSSTNATALPSRRSLIAQAGMLATIGAAGATLAIPALAMEAGPIERMHAEHVRLDRIFIAAIEAVEDAEERYEEPERPRWHPFAVEGGYVMIQTTPGRGISVLDDGPENIAYLKEAIAREYKPDDPNFGCPNKLRARRARKTLAKIETWKAEAQRRSDAAGLTKARRAEAKARAAVTDHAAKVFAIEPTTFREIAYQASVLVMTWDQGEADMLPERLVEIAGITPYLLDA